MSTRDNRETKELSRQTNLLTDLELATELAEEAKTGTGAHTGGVGHFAETGLRNVHERIAQLHA